MVSPILIFFHALTQKEAGGFALLVMLSEAEMHTSLSGSNAGSLCFTGVMSLTAQQR